MLQWVILVSCILSVGNRAKFIYRSVSLYMPSSSWHILLIGRELHTCNSKCFFLTLHLAVSTEASAWLSTNDLVLFSTLTSGDAFVSNRKMGWGREMRERTGNTTLIRWTQDELKSLNVWLRFTEAAHRPWPHKYIKTTVCFFYSLGYRHCSTKVRLKRNTQVQMPPHCGETRRWGMREEERRRRLAEASVVTAISAKSIGRWGSRREEA